MKPCVYALANATLSEMDVCGGAVVSGIKGEEERRKKRECDMDCRYSSKHFADAETPRRLRTLLAT